MKNKLKGFTLVELIVVMAIMSILMVGIMQMFKPVRAMYVDSTQYEAQRTVQSGVVRYITESVRYSTDMGVYNNVSTAKDAAKAFAEAYCDANGYDKTDNNNLEAIYKHVEIIIIENKTKHYSKNYTGRIVRRKVDGTDTSVNEPVFSGTNNIISPSTTNLWRTALGEAYYGENTYYITLGIKDDNTDGNSDDGMLTINVASTKNGKRDISKKGSESNFIDYSTTTGKVIDSSTDAGAAAVQTAINNDKIAVTRGAVLCRNLADSSNHGVNTAGVFNVNYSNSNANSKNAYIVFVNKDGKDAIEAEGLTT